MLETKPRRASAVFPADASSSPVSFEVNEIRPLAPVQALDGVMEANLGLDPVRSGQGIVEPLRPAKFRSCNQDLFLVGRRPQEMFQELAAPAESPVLLFVFRA